jgi:hypothetical protein
MREYCGTHIRHDPGSASRVFGRMAHLTAGYGGWSVLAEDYARFAMHCLNFCATMDDAASRFCSYDAGAQYVPARTSFQVGRYVGHSGRWTPMTRMSNIGALFFVSADGVTVVVLNSIIDYGLADDLYRVVRRP